MPDSMSLASAGGGQFAVGVDEHFAGGHVHHVGHHVGAFQVVGGNFHLLDLGLLDFLEQRGGDLLALPHHRFAALGGDGVGELQAGQALVHVPEQLLVLDGDLADAVEGAQDLLVGLETERAQEHRTVEFPFAVDTDVQDILDVVFEFHPASAVGNDLAEEVALRRNALEKHARRTVQLRNDHALGAVDDEGSVVRHQRNFAEEDFLLLDVADALLLRLRVLGIDRQPDGDLERARRRSCRAPGIPACRT